VKKTGSGEEELVVMGQQVVQGDPTVDGGPEK
jgi:hypothetical protein